MAQENKQFRMSQKNKVQQKNGHNLAIQTFPEEYDNYIPDNLSFSEYVLKRIQQWEHKVACEDFDTKKALTYKEIQEESYRLAIGLQVCCNLKKGDNVAIVLPNCLNYPIIVFAVTLCGGCAVLINPSQTMSELEHLFKLTKPKLCIGLSDFAIKLKELHRGVNPPVLVLNDDPHPIKDEITVEKLRTIGGDGEKFTRPIIDTRDDPALILFSSGTTGVPKGVILTHSNLIVARRQNDELGKCVRRKNPLPDGSIPVDECLAAVLPLFHSFGISTVIDNFMAGLRFVLIRNFTFHRFMQAIQDHKITIITVVPAIAVQLAKQPVEEHYDLKSLRVIRCGASSLSADIIKTLNQKLNCVVFQGYGMTEATIRSHANYKGVNREGSIGVVLPFCESKVVDIESKKSLGPHQEGEICVRGPIVMKGYIGDKEATRNAIDSEGWLHTGDVGYYDEDGYFFITDRLKELIKYKGFQVSPTELEKILLTHPDVMDAAVVPVADVSVGEIPRAYVVKRQGSTITGDELAAFLADKVSSYKRLRGGVLFIDAIPKTSTGKIIRRALKGQVSSKL